MNDSNEDEVQLEKERKYAEADKKYKEEQTKTPKNIGTEGKEKGIKSGNKEELRSKILLVGLVFVAILALYYIMSPYQNCVALERGVTHTTERSQTRFCFQETSW